MRPNIVVVPPPGLDRRARLWSASEVLHAQSLVAELPVEGLVSAALPGLAAPSAAHVGASPPRQRLHGQASNRVLRGDAALDAPASMGDGSE